MEFVHRPYVPHETIAAIATPPGEGSIAVVRISGKEALQVADKVFSKKVSVLPSHTVHFGRIIGDANETIDEVVLIVMKAPRSYTGEDTIEINCHGGGLISRKVLERVIQAGARPAQPGEFTFKAFTNGKLDLAQAEAVQELISAKNELALNAAEKQLQGALSKHISSFQKDLVDIAAILEAWVDFPEEGLEFATLPEIISSLEKTKSKMLSLASTFEDGKILHQGLSICLVGSPNVGKSSLMNALLGKDRAIVTAIPGTTRDLLEDEMRLGGLHFKLTDTAGIRETDEIVEQEGIRRSKKAMGEADLILLVLDASRGVTPEDLALIASAPKAKTLVIWNKIDLPHSCPNNIDSMKTVLVSAKENTGLDILRQTIDSMIWKSGPPSKEEVVIASVRQKEALLSAIDSTNCLIQGLETDVSPEFLSSDMRNILSELGTIIGTNVTEDILTAIFSKFCVGK